MNSRVLLVVSLLALVALAGCNGESTIAGTNGMRQVSGKVMPVGDLAGSSPAGIEVRVRGLGLTSLTDAEGAFVLTGLPEESVEISFSRAADGIDALLEVGVAEASITVDLQKKSATTRRRGARAPRIQLEGTITSISDTAIALIDASRKVEVTCAIVESTTIRKGNRSLTAADLAVDDRVHVTASPNADGSYTAIEIKLQEGEDDGEPGDVGPMKRELEGTVVAIDAATITVMDASTGEQSAAINAETVIRKGSTPLTPADVKPGDRVHVRARVEDDASLTALEIMVQKSR